ncbi:MAG TPA: lysylphosphatidylglycerol synthase transmembrane domain-containing protein [Gemmatimonadaceae bacterium]|nr:lysylphosphatidylglycerol synthase transmembrane domain-containing protein [Gemmatimonadaceae bacterium]
MRWREGARLAHGLWVAVPLAAAVIAYRQRGPLAEGLALLPGAHVGGVALGLVMVAVVYVARAHAYRVPLRVLHYSVRRRVLLAIAIVATSVHQAIPAAGASGYAFLTFALHRQGVSSGQAPLIALVDTLSYALAMATLVVAAVVYLLAGESTSAGALRAGVLPALAVVGLVLLAYVAQRRPARLERLVFGAKRRVERLLGRAWSDAPFRSCLAEYERGKAMIARRPGRFARMLAFQYAAIGADGAALYLAFGAVGAAPEPSTVFVGLVVSMAGGAVLGAPAGGGGFELIMTGFFVHHGMSASRAFAGTLLYRLLAFWLPVAAGLPLFVWLRRRRGGVRRERARR